MALCRLCRSMRIHNFAIFVAAFLQLLNWTIAQEKLPLPDHKTIDEAFVNVARTFAASSVLNKKLTSEKAGSLFSLIQSAKKTEVQAQEVTAEYSETIIFVMEYPKGRIFRISLFEEILSWPTKPFIIAIGAKFYRVDKQEGKRNFRGEIERICQIPPEVIELGK